MKKKTTWILGILLVIGILIWSSTKWIGGKKAIEVSADTVQVRDITEIVNASGKIKPMTEIKISSDVSGEIVFLDVKEGDTVQKGQLLARIRPDNYVSLVEQNLAALNASKANLSKAQADLAQLESQWLRAQIEAKRSQKLYEEKVIPETEWIQNTTQEKVYAKQVQAAEESAKAANFNIKSGEARLKESKENLRKTQIYAPISGIVSVLKVEIGERVVGTSQMTGTEMMRIANLQKMEVIVSVNENDVIRLQASDTAWVDVDAYSNAQYKFLGIVTNISSSAKETANADALTEFEVKIVLNHIPYKEGLIQKQTPSQLKPGMNATVEIQTQKKKNVLSLSLATIQIRNKSTKNNRLQEFVYQIQQDGSLIERNVVSNIADFQYIEIEKGLQKGDIVVSGPYQLLSKGFEPKVKVKVNSIQKGSVL